MTAEQNIQGTRGAQLDTAAFTESYRCPKCRARLKAQDDTLICSQCKVSYPIVDGVPVLIAESESVFRLADFTGVRVKLNVAGHCSGLSFSLL